MAYRIAALSLGVIIATYWGRVLRMARKARRRTGRAANLLPPEPVGRLLRFLWIPIVIVWLSTPFIVALANPRGPLLNPLMRSPWIAWPAVVLALACFWVTRICWRTMGRNWRMGIDPAERTSLVVAGPFAYVRHPIYALSQLMMLASVVAVPSYVMIAVGVMHIVLLQWEVRREEAHMLQVHGAAYTDYCARVGRFIPHRAAVPEVG
jgi:protein-S-isoprenylcysteine O-methyltransferase Ste14